MSPYHKKQKQKKRKNFFRKWHRRIGFCVAIFLINLAITGILLNHTDDLSLHKSTITTDWIINLYGIEAPTNGLCIPPKTTLPNNKVCQLGEKIYINDNQLINQSTSLIGLVELDELLYLATNNELIIYTPDFELVESFTQESGLPTPITQIGKSNQNDTEQLLILGRQEQWLLDQDSMEWSKTTKIISKVEKLIPLKDQHLLSLQNQYLDKQITHLKFIQDLHSGRIIGLPGKLMTDLVGIVILLLAVSGYLAWQKRKGSSN